MDAFNAIEPEKRIVYLLEKESLISYALKTLFNAEYVFQVIESPVDFLTIWNSNTDKSKFFFVNIASLSSQEVLKCFSREALSMETTLFYALQESANSTSLTDKIQF